MLGCRATHVWKSTWQQQSHDSSQYQHKPQQHHSRPATQNTHTNPQTRLHPAWHSKWYLLGKTPAAIGHKDNTTYCRAIHGYAQLTVPCNKPTAAATYIRCIKGAWPPGGLGTTACLPAGGCQKQWMHYEAQVVLLMQPARDRIQLLAAPCTARCPLPHSCRPAAAQTATATAHGAVFAACIVRRTRPAAAPTTA